MASKAFQLLVSYYRIVGFFCSENFLKLLEKRFTGRKFSRICGNPVCYSH